jgi:hypothetical protein
MAVRACDALPYLRLKSAMKTSDCNAVLKNGEKVEAFMYQGKPAIEINEQFFFADTYPEFAKYELKPVAAPPPAPVQLVNERVIEEPVVDTSGQRLRLQLARNPDLIYKRNIIRQVFGNLEVREYLGVGQNDSTTRFWYCFCTAHGRYVTATQAELVTQTVTDCNNAREHSEKIEFRGAQLP